MVPVAEQENALRFPSPALDTELDAYFGTEMNYRGLIFVLGLLPSLLLAGCVSGYSQFYESAPAATLAAINARRVAPAPATPTVERAAADEKILDAYAKRGYVMIGISMFNSARPPSEEAAVLQGKNVGADLVLILNPEYTGAVSSTVPITSRTTTTSYSSGFATAYGPAGTSTAYGRGTTTTYGSNTAYVPITIHRSDFGAVFFVKQRFGLGVFLRDLNDSERQELQSNKGAVVLLVVDDSPAFDADLLVGDVITGLDGITVANARTFNELVGDRPGKRVTLTVFRRGHRTEKSVQLNQ